MTGIPRAVLYILEVSLLVSITALFLLIVLHVPNEVLFVLILVEPKIRIAYWRLLGIRLKRRVRRMSQSRGGKSVVLELVKMLLFEPSGAI